MTIENETGIADIVVWSKLFERQRPEVIGSRLVAVTCRMQRIEDMSADLRLLERSQAARSAYPPRR